MSKKTEPKAVEKPKTYIYIGRDFFAAENKMLVDGRKAVCVAYDDIDSVKGQKFDEIILCGDPTDFDLTKTTQEQFAEKIDALRI